MDIENYDLYTHLNNSNPSLPENELENHESRQIMSHSDLFWISLHLGIFSFGGRLEQIELFKEKLIREKKHIKEKEFEYLYSLCQIFPGHTSTQLLFAIGICKSKTFLGGIISLVTFLSPSLLIMLLISFLAKSLKEYTLKANKLVWDPVDDFYFYYLSILGAGVCQGSVSLVIHNAIHLTKSLAKTRFDFSIIIISGVLYFFFNNFAIILMIMITAGFASCFQGDHDFFLDVCSTITKLDNIPFLGFPAFLTMITIYGTLFFSYLFVGAKSQIFYLMESFFRIGTFNFGGGHAVIPLMLAEYSKIIEEYEILHGYAVSSLLPGPLFNIAAFIGCLISGVIGGLIAFIFIMLPGIFLIMIILPHHNYLTKNNLIQHFLRGCSWATIGFIYIAGLRLWIDSCYVNQYTTYIIGSINIILCFFLLEIKYLRSRLIIVLVFGSIFSLFCKLIEVNFLQ